MLSVEIWLILKHPSGPDLVNLNASHHSVPGTSPTIGEGNQMTGRSQGITPQLQHLILAAWTPYNKLFFSDKKKVPANQPFFLDGGLTRDLPGLQGQGFKGFTDFAVQDTSLPKMPTPTATPRGVATPRQDEHSLVGDLGPWRNLRSKSTTKKMLFYCFNASPIVISIWCRLMKHM